MDFILCTQGTPYVWCKVKVTEKVKDKWFVKVRHEQCSTLVSYMGTEYMAILPSLSKVGFHSLKLILNELRTIVGIFSFELIDVAKVCAFSENRLFWVFPWKYVSRQRKRHLCNGRRTTTIQRCHVSKRHNDLFSLANITWKGVESISRAFENILFFLWNVLLAAWKTFENNIIRKKWKFYYFSIFEFDGLFKTYFKYFVNSISVHTSCICFSRKAFLENTWKLIISFVNNIISMRRYYFSQKIILLLQKVMLFRVPL